MPLRVRFQPSASAGQPDGVWWPQSRSLQTEAADLIDHLPELAPHVTYVNRLLFSRPDWDDGVTDGRGTRRIRAQRGPVKVGSFPGDDTHLMVLVLANGERLSLRVIAGDTDPAAGDAAYAADGQGS